MALHSLLIVLTAAANLALGLVVWHKNPKNKINQYFGIFSIAVAAWTLSNAFVAAYAASPWGHTWARLAFASGSIMPLAFLLFTSVFPSPLPPPPRKVVFLLSAAGIFAFLLSFSPLMVKATTSVNGTLQVTYGPLHPVFAIYIIVCVSFSLLLLGKKLFETKGIQNLQVRYVFLGFFIGALGATITNLIFPLVLGISRFSRYGPLFSILMMGVIAHSIIRYRLMNIRLVISRGVVYLLVVAAAGGFFVVLFWLASMIVVPPPRDLPLWTELGLVLLIALTFQPIKRWSQTMMDRYFYRDPYNYQRTIREASRTMGSILDLQSLLQYVCEVISKTVRAEFAAVYTKDQSTLVYRRLAIHQSIEVGTNPEREQVAASSPLVSFLPKQRDHILGDELGRRNPDADTRAALEHLRLLGGESALAIREEDRLIGFLLVGPKLSGDPYFSEDVDLLTTLVSQAAIAIKNAQLYREVALANEYVTNIVATMESGVIAVDTTGKITLFNPAAERITGLTRRIVLSGLTVNLPGALAHPLEATLQDGKPHVHAETAIPVSAGGYTPVSYSTAALRDRFGTVLGAVGVFSDLTRLKELEGEKRRAERLASIGALASGIAHEIKNPLVAIKTFAELLPERFTEQDFREDFSQVVMREITRIDDLVARLRGLATPAPRHLLSLDLREPIEETLVLLRGQLEQRRITVRRLYQEELLTVPGDPAQLKQLFLNLFMNAVEAMEVGGELTIRLSRRENAAVPSLLVEVSDTGTGIPREMLGRVFDPFVTTKPGGSGLGLAICRGIADAHRAAIRVENNSNRPGTTVILDFLVTDKTPAVIKV